MANSILAQLLQNKDIIDRVVNGSGVAVGENGNKFSLMFPLLFETGTGAHLNLMSFLEPVSKSFTCSSQFPEYIEIAKQIFLDLKIPTTETENTSNVLEFLAYLIQVYHKLNKDVDADTKRNIFRFMTDFSIQETKVVFVFHTPSGQAQTCGYALHGANVATTTKVLDLLNEELTIFEQFLKNKTTISISDEVLTREQQQVSFSGWLDQGVLLMNAKLTYYHDIWEPFTDCVVKVLSTVCPNLVFILSSGSAQDKRDQIQNKEKHMIFPLYHPTANDQPYEDKRWETTLPFLNANYFLYQVSGGNIENIIDWNSISSRASGREKRNGSFKTIFDTAQTLTCAESQQDLLLNKNLNGVGCSFGKVRGADCNFYYIRKIDCTKEH